jgi:hypothetical protein
MTISSINNKILNQVASYSSNKHILSINNENRIARSAHNIENGKRPIKNSFKLFYFIFLEYIYFLYEKLLSLPTRKIRVLELKKQLRSDLQLLSSHKLNQVADKVNKVVSSEGLFQRYTAKDRDYAKRIAIATYATTQQYYAPIVYKWALDLLQRAKNENTHLVFLARDGLPAYEMVKLIQENQPEDYKDVPIHYMYISRKIVDHHANSKAEIHLSDYIKQELLSPEKAAQDKAKVPSSDSIKQQPLSPENAKESKFLFIDIGFAGSMIERIKTQAVEAGIPEEKISFEYFISHTPQAKGFLGAGSQTINSVKSAGRNRCVHWLEDTHQGVISSSAFLVKENNKILPFTLSKECKKGTCKSRNELDYLCKKTALEALKDFARDQQRNPQFIPANHEKFDDWLLETKRNRMLYVDHV